MLGDADQHLSRAKEALSRETPAELAQNQQAARARHDKLRADVKSLNMIKRAHEKITSQEEQMQEAANAYDNITSCSNTKTKLQLAQV